MLILMGMRNAEVKIQQIRAEEGSEEGLSLTEAKTGPQRRTCAQWPVTSQKGEGLWPPAGRTKQQLHRAASLEVGALHPPTAELAPRSASAEQGGDTRSGVTGPLAGGTSGDRTSVPPVQVLRGEG